MKSQLSFLYNYLGKLDKGYKTSHEALRIAEESDDLYSKTWAFPFHGISCYYKGFNEEAVEILLKGIDFCERTNFYLNSSVAHYYLGKTYFNIREYQKSKAHCEKANWNLRQNRFLPCFVKLTEIYLEKIQVVSDERKIDLESLYDLEAENIVKIYDGWMQRYISEILFNIDDQHIFEAEEWIKKAIESDKINGMFFYLGKDYTSYAELLKRKKEPLKAKEKLSKAIELFNECGADGWQEKAELELASLS